jgi:probable HAF family extracellular repeat protein
VFAQRFPVFFTALLVAALSVSAPRPAVADDDGYTITDLGALPDKGKPYSAMWQQTINNAGVVVADANADPSSLFFNGFIGDSPFISINGTITPLPELPDATGTTPEHINNKGQVVGRYTPAGAYNEPVLWDKGVIQVLPVLPGDNRGNALTINDRGQAAGYSANTTAGTRFAVVWDKGTVSELTPLPGGGGFDEALGINEKGQVVGWSGPAPGSEHIAFWDKDGSVHDLGTLGGAFGDAYQINNKGQVVGTSATATNPNGDPFLWDDGVLTDLGYPTGDVFGVAADINHKGQIVGLSASDPNDPTTYHALLLEKGKMTDLQTKIPAHSGWQLVWALGINERGQIVGTGLLHGNFRACLLTPRDERRDR